MFQHHFTLYSLDVPSRLTYNYRVSMWRNIWLDDRLLVPPSILVQVDLILMGRFSSNWNALRARLSAVRITSLSQRREHLHNGLALFRRRPSVGDAGPTSKQCQANSCAETTPDFFGSFDDAVQECINQGCGHEHRFFISGSIQSGVGEGWGIFYWSESGRVPVK